MKLQFEAHAKRKAYIWNCWLHAVDFPEEVYCYVPVDSAFERFSATDFDTAGRLCHAFTFHSKSCEAVTLTASVFPIAPGFGRAEVSTHRVHGSPGGEMPGCMESPGLLPLPTGFPHVRSA